MFNKGPFQWQESINSSDQYIDTATTYIGEVRFDNIKYELKNSSDFLGSVRQWILTSCIQPIDLFSFDNLKKQTKISSSERISCSSHDSPSHPVDDVANEVEEQLQDLKEVAEGYAKPEGETTSQCVEQAPVFDSVVNLILYCVFIQS